MDDPEWQLRASKIKLSKAFFVSNHVETNLNMDMDYTPPNPSLDFCLKFFTGEKKIFVNLLPSYYNSSLFPLGYF